MNCSIESLALLDERGDDLPRLGVVERAALLDLAVHERRLEHAQRAEPRRVLLAHRVGDGGADVVDERHATLTATGAAGRLTAPGCGAG